MATLSYDGRGINGPAPERARVATFTDAQRADEWGPLLAAAPELLAALRGLLLAVESGPVDDAALTNPDSEIGQACDAALAAIAKAEGKA
jgi:hypothetical protein